MHALTTKSARKYALKCQYEIDNAQIYGWMSSKTSGVCVHMESQIKKALWPERQKLLLDADKPLIAYYMALGCLDG